MTPKIRQFLTPHPQPPDPMPTPHGDWGWRNLSETPARTTRAQHAHHQVEALSLSELTQSAHAAATRWQGIPLSVLEPMPPKKLHATLAAVLEQQKAAFEGLVTEFGDDFVEAGRLKALSIRALRERAVQLLDRDEEAMGGLTTQELVLMVRQRLRGKQASELCLHVTRVCVRWWGVKVFFQNPHMCVQNDQCHEGIVLRYVMLGHSGSQPGCPPSP